MKRNGKIALVILMLVSILTPVIAYVNNYLNPKEVPVGVVVRLPTEALVGIYWDYDCTDPVTHIDFGSVPQLENSWQYLDERIYIRNEQPDREIWIYWSSTLHDITDEIEDSWFYNATHLNPDNIVWSEYRIRIPPDTAIGNYNWTLNLWAEY